MPKPTSPEGISTIIDRLRDSHPNARYELDWETPEQLLVATILAAQCTDERVNKVTKTLFQKYSSPQAFADADLAELEEELRPTGFYRQKAKTVKEVNRALCERFDGRVPDSMEAMITLPGVARKSANVVLNTAFQMPTGIIVDTHVSRVAPRLGLTKKEKPEEIEEDLMKLVPKDEWTFFGPAMVLHGRYTCVAKKPKCGECNLEELCEKRGVE
ncbi:MAG: endonuclease III [Polyangiaceae bacterium]|nr:endonuclease III [Polyangiaceae bacterium]NUQ79074.1 endonuclease III [Polyangiaceae bacterium]